MNSSDNAGSSASPDLFGEAPKKPRASRWATEAEETACARAYQIVTERLGPGSGQAVSKAVVAKLIKKVGPEAVLDGVIQTAKARRANPVAYLHQAVDVAIRRRAERADRERPAAEPRAEHVPMVFPDDDDFDPYHFERIR